MKQIRWILGTVILIMIMTFNMSFTSNAYTEEQKQQAKAWLSAHGYSPDMGGANQAYQDYLNGKFDEELGVDVNGDGIPATAQTTENSTEEDTEEYADADLEDGEDDTEEDSDSDTAQDSSDATTDPSGADSAEDSDGTTGDSTEDGMATGITDGEGQTDDSVEMVEQSEEEAECGMDDQQSSKSTLYQPEKKDEYQEGMMVIVLAVVLMLLAGIFMRR